MAPARMPLPARGGMADKDKNNTAPVNKGIKENQRLALSFARGQQGAHLPRDASNQNPVDRGVGSKVWKNRSELEQNLAHGDLTDDQKGRSFMFCSLAARR